MCQYQLIYVLERNKSALLILCCGVFLSLVVSDCSCIVKLREDRIERSGDIEEEEDIEEVEMTRKNFVKRSLLKWKVE